MVANNRGRTPVRAAKLNVELLENRDAASATPGYVVEYQEGYEYGDGTAMGWATGSYTVVPNPDTPAPAPETPAATAKPVPVESGKTAVYLDGELVAEVEGEPALAFLAPPTTGSVLPGGETIVYVNGQPVGTVEGIPAVAILGPAVRGDADGEEVLSGLSYHITGTNNTGTTLPDEENFDLTLTAWVG